MEYRTLGRTGIRVSAIALGCEGFINKSAQEVKADFDFAIDRGINFVDIYSSNPDLRDHIGQALEGRRDRFVIQGHLCTTWENDQYLRTRDPKKTIESFDSLLKQLRTDHVDVGMIHYVDAEKDFHTVFDHEIIEIAQRLKAEGKIRHIGMSSHNPLVASMAVKTGLIDVLLFSINPCYDLLPPNEDVDVLFDQQSYAGALHNIDPAREQLYALCEREGVAIDVMKVFGGGDLLDQENSPFGCAFTPVQAIDYALTRPAVAAVMLGCKTQDEMAAAIAGARDKQEQLALIESQLQDATQIICDIYSRYRFETMVFANREQDFMHADTLCGFMEKAQKESYGDGLDPEFLHPYMWVCKGHYYGPTFYNFPYAFGGLFARGLYAQYQQEGEAFVPKYKKLLYTTPVASVEDTAKVAGIDLGDKNFWRSALQTIADQIDLFCKLIGE